MSSIVLTIMEFELNVKTSLQQFDISIIICEINPLDTTASNDFTTNGAWLCHGSIPVFEDPADHEIHSLTIVQAMAQNAIALRVEIWPWAETAEGGVGLHLIVLCHYDFFVEQHCPNSISTMTHTGSRKSNRMSNL